MLEDLKVRNRWGSVLCPHNRVRNRCIKCKGSGICEHGRMKTNCTICVGSQICEHGRRRYRCKNCGGSCICEHNRVRSVCVECGGSEICEHQQRRRMCKQCGGFKVRAKFIEYNATRRAKKDNLPYELTIDWIIEKLKEGCPVFGVPFKIYSKRKRGIYSASLDKFIPHLGYTKENSFIISWLANKIKSDATVEQVRAVADWMGKVEKNAEQSESPAATRTG